MDSGALHLHGGVIDSAGSILTGEFTYISGPPNTIGDIQLDVCETVRLGFRSWQTKVPGLDLDEIFKALFAERLGKDSRRKLAKGCSKGRTFKDVIKEMKDQMQYFDQLHIIHNRKLFVTSFHRLGLGPKKMIEGDKISILHRSGVPVVLREVGLGKYMVIGQCYIGEGVMSGLSFLRCESEAQTLSLV